MLESIHKGDTVVIKFTEHGEGYVTLARHRCCKCGLRAFAVYAIGGGEFVCSDCRRVPEPEVIRDWSILPEVVIC